MLFRSGFVGRQIVASGSGVGRPPSLDFNFTSGSLDPSITWTRNSTATDGLYTDLPGTSYNTFGINVPRVSSRGVLVENAMANFLINSDAPVTQTTASLAIGTYCLWCIGTGSATSSAGTAVGTGFGAATPGVPNIISITTAGTVTVTVAGALNRFQLEKNNYPTSYIPTLGVSVIRLADLGVINTGPWYNAAEGTLVTDFNRIVGPNGAFNDLPALYQSNTDMIGARIPGAGNIQAIVWLANTLVSLGSQFPYSLNVPNRIGISYNVAAAMMQSVVNGGTVSQSATATFPTVTQIRIGLTRSFALDGYIRRIRYWPRALSGAEMQSATSVLNDILTLDFMTPGVIDNRITLNRATPATWIDSSGNIQTAVSGQPRWEWLQGVLQGLLVEEARTNLVTQSSDPTQAVWTKANCTLSAGVPGPNGATTGVGVIGTGAPIPFMQQSQAVVAGTTYTASCFIKAARDGFASILIPGTMWADTSNRSATFNLTTGAIFGTSGSTVTAGTQAFSNGWYRCWMTFTPDISITGGIQLFRGNASGDGVTVQSYAWGGQLEVGAFATSFISSGASATLRAGEFYDITPIASWFNAVASTGVVEFLSNNYAMAGGGVLRFDDLTSANSFNWNLLDTPPYRGLVSSVTTNVVVVNTLTPTIAFGAVHKFGFAIDASNSKYGMDGVVAPTGFGAQTLPLGLARLRIGTTGTGVARNVNGYVRKVTYWPRVLSNAELQQATT